MPPKYCANSWKWNLNSSNTKKHHHLNGIVKTICRPFLFHPLLNVSKHKFFKWEKYSILRGFVNIICPSKELVQVPKRIKFLFIQRCCNMELYGCISLETNLRFFIVCIKWSADYICVCVCVCVCACVCVCVCVFISTVKASPDWTKQMLCQRSGQRCCAGNHSVSSTFVATS